MQAHFPPRTVCGIPALSEDISKLDESCISNPKSEISDWTVQSDISDFGFEMQDSSNFEIHLRRLSHTSGFTKLGGRFPFSTASRLSAAMVLILIRVSCDALAM